MMKLTAVEAKNKFDMLLDRVEKGEEIVITRHWKVIARLVPNVEDTNRSCALAALKRIRDRAKDIEQRFDWAALKRDRDAERP